jgi:cytochrome c oxidase subunit 2
MKTNRRRFTLALAGLLLGGTFGALGAAQPKEKVVKIVARRFTYNPNRLTLKMGVPVVFELTSLDVVMGFSLPDFQTRADIVPGKVTRLRFTPDKAGSFTFLCDIFCGSGHETMNGTLNVVA